MRKLEAAARKLRIFHGSVDARVDDASRELRTLGRALSCKAGCGVCCQTLVEITVLEAVMLLQPILANSRARAYFETHDVPILRRHVELLRPGTTPQEWRERGLLCVFLDVETERCKRYRDRPTACRKHVVISPPEHCADPRIPVAAIRIPGAIDQAKSISEALGEDCGAMLGHVAPMPIALDLAGILLSDGADALRKRIEA